MRKATIAVIICRHGILLPSQIMKNTGIKNPDAKTAKAKNVYFYGMDQPDVFIIIFNDRRNDNAIQDCSVAAENIMLAAASYGIGSVWINVLKHIGNEPEVRNRLTELGIPEKHDV